MNRCLCIQGMPCVVEIGNGYCGHVTRNINHTHTEQNARKLTLMNCRQYEIQTIIRFYSPFMRNFINRKIDVLLIEIIKIQSELKLGIDQQGQNLFNYTTVPKIRFFCCFCFAFEKLRKNCKLTTSTPFSLFVKKP